MSKGRTDTNLFGAERVARWQTVSWLKLRTFHIEKCQGFDSGCNFLYFFLSLFQQHPTHDPDILDENLVRNTWSERWKRFRGTETNQLLTFHENTLEPLETNTRLPTYLLRLRCWLMICFFHFFSSFFLEQGLPPKLRYGSFWQDSMRYRNTNVKPWLDKDGTTIWPRSRILVAKMVRSQSFETFMGIVIMLNILWLDLKNSCWLLNFLVLY